MKYTRRAMTTLTLAASAIALSAWGLGDSHAASGPEIGVAAPTFNSKTTKGETFDLSAFEGKRVILEWTNHDCPFVVKHYGTENMQTLQKDMAEKDVVWVSIISSAPGTQGHVSAEKANALTEERDAAPSHVVLDPSGKIGRMYGAQTTPHMYIVDTDGTLAYKGGIDDTPTARWSDVERANNYVRAAMDDLENDRPVANPVTRAYGCSIKYGPNA